MNCPNSAILRVATLYCIFYMNFVRKIFMALLAQIRENHEKFSPSKVYGMTTKGASLDSKGD